MPTTSLPCNSPDKIFFGGPYDWLIDTATGEVQHDEIARRANGDKRLIEIWSEHAEHLNWQWRVYVNGERWLGVQPDDAFIAGLSTDGRLA